MRNKPTFLEFLGICCIFSVFLDKAIRGVFIFDFYYNYVIFLTFMVALIMNKGKIATLPKWFMRGFAIILVSSLFILSITNLLGFEFWKQVFGIAFTALVFYNVIYVFNFDISRIFNYYLKFAYWISLFGIIDNALHVSGLHITNVLKAGLLYRESSVMGEPFYLALALTPALSYYTAYFKRTWQQKKLQLVTIFLCSVVTYSSIAVAGIAISVFFSLYFNDYFNLRKNRLIVAPLLIIPIFLFVNFLIENVKLINARFTDTTDLFFSTELQTSEAGRSNSSTFALYSNFIIARDSFIQEPLFGSGLGSHPIIFKETFLKYFPSVYLDRYGAQNQQDANSKFLRLMSETGLVGLFLFMYAFIKFFVPKKKMITEDLREMGAINYSIFIYIILCLIRNGNYINVGFFLFFFIYYLSWKIVQTKHTYLVRSQPTFPG